MKKLMCLTLSILMVIGVAVPIFAAETKSKGLEEAIVAVKKVVTIPEQYVEFNYSSYQQEREGKDSITVWDLQWSKEDGKASITAAVDELGNLIGYSSYAYNENSGLAKVTRQEGAEKAEAFLAKAMPTLAGNMRLTDKNQAGISSSRNLNYTYQLYVNDIPVSFVRVDLSVDKYTGEITNFDGLNAGWTLPEFPDKDEICTTEEALKHYEEKLGAKLSYYTSYNHEKKELSVFPGYAMSQAGEKAIDAKTGEVVNIYTEGSGKYYFNLMKSRDTGDAAKEEAAVGLSPQEQAAVEKVSGLITKEKAESILRNVAGVSKTKKVTGSRLSQDTINEEQYSWNLYFESAFGTVDARTGEVLSFSLYEDGLSGRKNLTFEQAKQKAELFVKENAGEKFEKTLLREEESSEISPMPKEETEMKTSYRFSYVRQENDIDVVGNGLDVTIDAKTGMISYYSCKWYENAVFPSVEKAISAAEALNAFNENGKLGLTYAWTGVDQVSLVYNFENNVTAYLIDPFTGTRINREGKPYKDGLVPEYNDIKGHWAEKTVQALLNNGYYIEGTEFQPDSVLTQEGFLRYLYAPRQAAYDQEDFYKMLENNKIILSGEKAPNQAITRQEAAKFMVRHLGFDLLAKKSNIFINPFKDKMDETYKGYAAICNGLGIIKGDQAGNFNGAKALTRAEAASALYQLLEVK